MASYPAPTRMIQRLQESIGERLLISYPVKDLPINIRPVRLRPKVEVKVEVMREL